MRRILITGCCLGIYYWLSPGTTGYSDQVDLARALIHGHFYLDNSPYAHFVFNGNVYCYQPPGVALVLAPFVWLWGTINQVHASLLFGTLGVALLAGMVVRPQDRIWLGSLLGLGSVYAWCVTVGDSWNTALSFTIPFSLLAIKHTFFDSDNGNPVKAGFWAGAASLCRYDPLLAWPLYAIMWWRRQSLELFLIGLLPALVILLLYQWERFGQFGMTGYYLGNASFGPTANRGWELQYLPVNIYALVFRPPKLDAVWPYLHPTMAGQALIFTSPAFVSCLRVRERSLRIWLLLAMAAAVSIPSLLFCNDGFPQFGARHFIQMYPFLFGLMLIHSEEEGLDRFDKILVSASMTFVCIALVHIHYYGWTAG